MDHFSHEHPLILNADYIAGEGDVCNACNEEIVSCKSFVFSCSRSIIMDIPSSDLDEKCIQFLLHKTCAELPRRIENPEEFFVLHINPRKTKRSGQNVYMYTEFNHCDMCLIKMPWYYCSDSSEFFMCLKCAMSQVDSLRNHKFKHPAHSQHPLALIQRPSSFKCDACNVKNNTEDMSYKCIDCPFWMHKSCADELNTNFWFYHCNDCDLSFHLRCYEYSCHLNYSLHIKFGATNIIIDKFHPHSLTFVLNKKSRRCGKCHTTNLGEPILECAPCKTIFCKRCWKISWNLFL